MIKEGTYCLKSCPVCRPCTAGAADSVRDMRCGSQVATETSPSCRLATREASDVRTFLLVENRNDVSTTLGEALVDRGIRIIRANYAAEAIRRYAGYPIDRIAIRGEQPYESVWLFTAKLRLSFPTARICAYMSGVLPRDLRASMLLGVEKPVESDGDMSTLAAKLLEELTRA